MNKKIKQILRVHKAQLESSPKDLKSVFRIMFLEENEILAEKEANAETMK